MEAGPFYTINTIIFLFLFYFIYFQQNRTQPECGADCTNRDKCRCVGEKGSRVRTGSRVYYNVLSDLYNYILQ